MKIIMLIVGLLSRPNPVFPDYSKAIAEGFKDALREMGYPVKN